MRNRVDWSTDVHHALRQAEIIQVAYVPDSGLSEIISKCRSDKRMTAISLTSEQEGVGLICGAWLGGQRAVLLMQSSGVGNCINALSMVKTCGFPFLAIVTMRGMWAEFNPWQVPMGQISAPALTLASVIVQEVDRAEDVGDAVAAAAHLAFDSGVGVAVLISQRVIGAKAFVVPK